MWKKNKLPKYSLVERNEIENFAIQINSGKFKDIVYSYMTVSVWENTGETATLKFDYCLHENPNSIPLNEEFETLAGDIAVSILTN